MLDSAGGHRGSLSAQARKVVIGRVVAQAGTAPHIGVSLGPDRSSAAVVCSAAVLSTVTVDGSDPDELLSRIAGACPQRPRRVIVDISRLLLAPLLSASSRLAAVTAIRVLPRVASDSSLSRHPNEVIERLVTRRFTVRGGHDLFGRELRPLDLRGLSEVGGQIRQGSDRCVAVVAAGSQADPRHEREVADALQATMPDAQISVAHEFGSRGLAAREATVILNSALIPVANQLLDNCNRVIARVLPGAALHVSQGDGGWANPWRIRTSPVLGLGALEALELLGAATRAGVSSCRVLLDRPSSPVIGHVHNGLVSIQRDALSEVGIQLAVPNVALTRTDVAPTSIPGTNRTSGPPAPSGVTGTAGPSGANGTFLFEAAAAELDELACLGAAVSHPTAWLDEIASIRSRAELEVLRRDAQARATVILTANGAAPGTAEVVEISTVAMPYSPSGTVRVRVRMAGAPDGASADCMPGTHREVEHLL